MTHTFTPAERDLIRRQFGSGWGEPRPLSGGVWLHRWASGPKKGQPKLGKAVQSLLARGLVEIVDPERGFPCAQFTAAGLEALRAMAADARQLDPVRFGHLIEGSCGAAADDGRARAGAGGGSPRSPGAGVITRLRWCGRPAAGWTLLPRLPHSGAMTDPDRRSDPGPPLDRSSGTPPLTDPEWLLIADAAQAFGISKEALRSKVKRGTLRSMKGNDGLLRVLIHPGPTLDRPRADLGQNRPAPDQPDQAPPPAEVVAALQTQVATLAAQLAAAEQRLADREAHAAARLQDRDAEVERLRHDHQEEVNRLRADQSTALDQARAEAERMRAAHDAELARLQQVIDWLTAPWWRRWFGRR